MSEAAKKPALTPLDDALATLLAQIQPLAERETLPTSAARGRVLAADLISPVDVPPADNSAMDGYAFNSLDIADEGQTTLSLIGTAYAGNGFDQPVQKGQCVGIMTGAMMPTHWPFWLSLIHI